MSHKSPLDASMINQSFGHLNTSSDHDDLSDWNTWNADDEREDPVFVRDQFDLEEIVRAYIFYNVVYLFLLVVCTVGNALNLMVILRTRYKWQSSARCYMLVTSVADLAALWLGFPSRLFDLSDIFQWPLYTWQMKNQAGIKLSYGITAWSQFSLMRLADWILVAFSWERLLIILSPFRLDFLQRNSTAQIISCILLVLALLDSMLTFVDGYFKFNFLQTRVEIPAWVARWRFQNDIAEVVVTLLTFLLILIPSAFLIGFLARYRRSTISQKGILNRARSKSAQTDIGNQTSSPTSRNAKSFYSSNILLLSSAGLYLLTRIPIIILSGILTAQKNGYIRLDQSSLKFATPFVNAAMYMGYSFTFFVYLISERHFRECFVKVITAPIFPRWRTGKNSTIRSGFAYTYTSGQSTASTGISYTQATKPLMASG
ncbi:uncharacterized protein LOC129601034 [Paramacrobiotus metropolitanus]|uniref:uncharacterized protein LOC129601034 n=1 Tax=Paramacrobiotus metropolitanus TaxID=2943436 RepID=UPI00244643D2|nr:uncharacterized protein LOC129601034 [Paramacrobiotus metropolitanus]